MRAVHRPKEQIPVSVRRNFICKDCYNREKTNFMIWEYFKMKLKMPSLQEELSRKNGNVLMKSASECEHTAWMELFWTAKALHCAWLTLRTDGQVEFVWAWGLHKPRLNQTSRNWEEKRSPVIGHVRVYCNVWFISCCVERTCAPNTTEERIEVSMNGRGF